MADMYVKGEGGSIIPMDLPLPEGIRTRFAKGELRRVNADGTPYRDEPAEQVDEPDAAQENARPAQAATKAAWIDYVVRAELLTAEEATTLTKADLIELASAEPE